jgi:hypothetical protein
MSRRGQSLRAAIRRLEALLELRGCDPDDASRRTRAVRRSPTSGRSCKPPRTPWRDGRRQ